MMTLSASNNKKRPSNDDSEFMPVTKRMNQLSIDNSRESTNDSTTSGGSSTQDENELNVYEVAHYLNQQQQQLQHQHYLNELYNPCLTSNQNPNYYEANRVLFEAHQERITRLQSQIKTIRS